MKNKNPQLKDFILIPEFTGTILGGIWIKKDGSELKIKIASRDDFLHFRPLKENEESL